MSMMLIVFGCAVSVWLFSGALLAHYMIDGEVDPDRDSHSLIVNEIERSTDGEDRFHNHEEETSMPFQQSEIDRLFSCSCVR